MDLLPNVSRQTQAIIQRTRAGGRGQGLLLSCEMFVCAQNHVCIRMQMHTWHNCIARKPLVPGTRRYNPITFRFPFCFERCLT